MFHTTWTAVYVNNVNRSQEDLRYNFEVNQFIKEWVKNYCTDNAHVSVSRRAEPTIPNHGRSYKIPWNGLVCGNRTVSRMLGLSVHALPVYVYIRS